MFRLSLQLRVELGLLRFVGFEVPLLSPRAAGTALSCPLWSSHRVSLQAQLTGLLCPGVLGAVLQARHGSGGAVLATSEQSWATVL